MPRLIATEPGPPLDLPGFVAELEAARFDPSDEESFVGIAPALRRLACNSGFLGDALIAALADGAIDQARSNRYNAQVVMLHRADDWFVRANLWPALTDPAVRSSGTAPFFYGVPHDHNFNFLSVCYFGPGYESDFWEVETGSFTGLVGERVTLIPRGRQRLGPGQVMLYRAHRDVHAQQPPAALSVTLNVMQAGRDQPLSDQYRFDTEAGTIAAGLTHSALDALLPLALRLGGADGHALVADHAASHPSGRIRFGAIRALAALDPDRGRERLASGARDPDGFVAGACAAARDRTDPDAIAARAGAVPG